MTAKLYLRDSCNDGDLGERVAQDLEDAGQNELKHDKLPRRHRQKSGRARFARQDSMEPYQSQIIGTKLHSLRELLSSSIQLAMLQMAQT